MSRWGKMYDSQSHVSQGWALQEREEESVVFKEHAEGSGSSALEEDGRRTVIIYALASPEGEVRYVGKTIVKLYQRLCQHYRSGKNTYKDSWIASMKRKGQRPIIMELERFDNSDGLDWQESERFWITYLRFLGCRLTNLDAGGNGGTTHAEETKKKIGNGNRGKKRTPDQIETLRKSHLGVKLTQEHCESMSKATRGKPRGKYSEERIEKIAAANRGKKRPRTPEHQAKLTASQVGKKRPHETCEKISAAQKGKKRGPYSEERVAKAVAGMTEEARKKMSEASLKRWGKLPKKNPDPTTNSPPA